MTSHLCGYCQAVAVTTIPAIPEHACLQHAEEFWHRVIAEVAQREEPPTPPEPPTPNAPVKKAISKSRSRR